MKPVPFDKVASYYDRLARLVFGNSIREAQKHYLSEIQEGDKVLIIGGGTGWILEDMSILKNCKITYLEASEAMLKKAIQHYHRLKENLRSKNTEVEFLQGSVEALSSTASFQVVITFFFLDVYAHPDAIRLMQKLNDMLLPGGIWLYADFEKSGNPIKRAWQLPMLWLMYRFFQITTKLENNRLPNLKLLFNVLELQLKKQRSFYHTFIRSAVYQKQKLH